MSNLPANQHQSESKPWWLEALLTSSR